MCHANRSLYFLHLFSSSDLDVVIFRASSLVRMFRGELVESGLHQRRALSVDSRNTRGLVVSVCRGTLFGEMRFSISSRPGGIISFRDYSWALSGEVTSCFGYSYDWSSELFSKIGRNNANDKIAFLNRCTEYNF